MNRQTTVRNLLLFAIVAILAANLLKTVDHKEIKRQIYECEISYENWLSFEKSRFEYLAETDEKFKELWNIQNSIDAQTWTSNQVSKLTRENYEERKKSGHGDIFTFRSVPVAGNEIRIAGIKIYTSSSDTLFPSISKLWNCKKINIPRAQDKYEMTDDKHILVYDKNKIFPIRDEEDEIIDAENMRYFSQVSDPKNN